jgi:hypothetical protein
MPTLLWKPEPSILASSIKPSESKSEIAVSWPTRTRFAFCAETEKLCAEVLIVQIATDTSSENPQIVSRRGFIGRDYSRSGRWLQRSKDNRFRSGEHPVKHRLSQFTGECILLAWMKGGDKSKTSAEFQLGFVPELGTP